MTSLIALGVFVIRVDRDKLIKVFALPFVTQENTEEKKGLYLYFVSASHHGIKETLQLYCRESNKITTWEHTFTRVPSLYTSPNHFPIKCSISLSLTIQ